MTRLIVNDTTKNAIANMSFSIIKQMIPITNSTLDVIARAFNTLGLICVTPSMIFNNITNHTWLEE